MQLTEPGLHSSPRAYCTLLHLPPSILLLLYLPLACTLFAQPWAGRHVALLFTQTILRLYRGSSLANELWLNILIVQYCLFPAAFLLTLHVKCYLVAVITGPSNKQTFWIVFVPIVRINLPQFKHLCVPP
ncbi:hypothetical protein XENTR_v10022870 [Xenopus tropicalis]|nr:hypothetical protein XENTR_v10022870 [Xenopus tropicalis]